MGKITVYVISKDEDAMGFYPTSSILLEQTSPTRQFYQIDVNEEFEAEPTTDRIPYWYPPKASNQNVISFEIEAELNDIIDALAERVSTTNFDVCLNNCADLSAWFLENFADIPNPSSCGAPLSCNWLGICIVLPSFLQCCTLPSRVIDYTESALKNKGLTKQKNGSITHYSGMLFSSSNHNQVLEASPQTPLIHQISR